MPPANWREHIRESLKTLSLCCNTQAKNHVGTIPVPPRKITFAEMRDMGVRGVLIYAPTIVAATRSRSAPMAGLMMSGCPILSPALRVEHCGKRGADVRPDFNWSSQPTLSVMASAARQRRNRLSK